MARWGFAVMLPLLMLTTVEAVAHARLDHAEPGPDTTVAPPPQVSLSFTEQLEPAFSAVTVTDAAGQRVEAGRTEVSGSRMSVPLRSLENGVYRVMWRAVSVDTHRTEGSFTFRVGK
jgi:methionine-rich copper-binding protein CopC